MKLAVAHSSPAALELLRRIVGAQHEICFAAQDANEVLRQCRRLRPDAVLLELSIPGGGVALTGRIMAAAPCPIVLIATNPALAVSETYAAMAAGAVGVIEMPETAQRAAPLLAKLAMVARLVGGERPRSTASDGQDMRVADLPPLIAIGASTGGPPALNSILMALPPDLQAALPEA